MNKSEKVDFIRNKLSKKIPSIGSWIQTNDSNIAEIIGFSGYDWVAVDMEHGSISVSNLPNIFRSIELGNSLPLARISKVNAEQCKAVLDAGAGGIIVANIETAEQIQNLVSLSSWPPTGSRGVGFSRSNLFGINFEEYRLFAQNPLLVGMIESKKALSNLNDILSSDKLDAILIGPYDLSASLGVTGEFHSKAFIEAINFIHDTANQFNKPIGIHIVHPESNELDKRINEGYTFIPYAMDTTFVAFNAKNPRK